MKLIPLIPIALLVATGLFVAEASAQTWTDVSPPKGPFEDVVDLAIDPTDQDHMFSTLGAASGQVLFESVDGGVTWQTVTLPGVGSYDPVVKIDRHGTVYLMVGSTLTPTNAAQYLFRRTATGTWTAFGPTTSFASQHLGRVFAVGYGDSDLMAFWLAERGGDEYGSSTYLYLSSDGGATWTALYQTTTHPRTLTIVERAGGPHLIYSGSIFPSTGVEHFFARTTGWSVEIKL